MATDVFQSRDAAQRRLAQSIAALQTYTDEIDVRQAASLKTAGDFGDRIVRRSQACRLLLDACRRNYERLCLQIENESRSDINQLSIEFRQLQTASSTGIRDLLQKKAAVQKQVDADAADFEAADNRSKTDRIISLWKFRTFIRLQPTRPDSANRMAAWIDKIVRPYVTKIYVENRSYFWYEVEFATGRVAVYLPSKEEPYGRLELHNNYPSIVVAPFRIRSPIWSAKPSSAGPELFDFGRFVLATYLTVPGPDLAHIRSDYVQRLQPSAIDRRERFLLRKSTVVCRKRRRIGLIEYWLVCLPADLCRLILDYFG